MAKVKIYLMLIILIFFLTLLSQSKDFSQKISMSTFRRQNAWKYLGRMHFDPGNMNINHKISFSAKSQDMNDYELDLLAIPSSIWHLALSTKCNQQQLSAQDALILRQNQIIIPSHLNKANNYVFSTISTMEIPTDETYNFVLRHCNKMLLNSGYGRDSNIEIELDIRNNEKLNSSTQHAYGWSLPLLILIYIFMIMFLWKQKEEQGDNWIKSCLKVSIIIGAASIVFKYLGYIVYAYISGGQYQFFDFVFMLFHSTSDGILIVLIVLIAYGWTVTFKNSMDFDIYVPLACMLGFINIIMTLLTKINDGDHDKYHMYDSIPAYVLIGFRILGFMIFIGGIIKSIVYLKPQEKKTKQYFIQLGVLGSFYILLVPLALLIIQFIDTKYRKQAMYFGLEVIRLILNAWLCILSGYKKSSYRQLINKSFMQKGQKFL